MQVSSELLRRAILREARNIMKENEGGSVFMLFRTESGAHGHGHVAGVFSSKEKAKAAMQKEKAKDKEEDDHYDYRIESAHVQ
jgi:hypothetical protein